MLIQANQNCPIQRQNFGIKIFANRTVKKCIIEDMRNSLKFDNKISTYKKLYKMYQDFEQVFENITNTIKDGFILLDFPKDKTDVAQIIYMTKKENYTDKYSAIQSGVSFLPNENSTKGPYQTTLLQILAKISGAMEKHDKAENPFQKLFYSIL